MTSRIIEVWKEFEAEGHIVERVVIVWNWKEQHHNGLVWEHYDRCPRCLELTTEYCAYCDKVIDQDNYGFSPSGQTVCASCLEEIDQRIGDGTYDYD